MAVVVEAPAVTAIGRQFTTIAPQLLAGDHLLLLLHALEPPSNIMPRNLINDRAFRISIMYPKDDAGGVCCGSQAAQTVIVVAVKWML